MNLKIFLNCPDSDWMIDPTDFGSLKNLYDEILFEMKEYADDTADDFVVLHDKTLYQILVVLKSEILRKNADGDVQDNLKDLAEEDK